MENVALAQTARRVLRALARGDWTAFRRECAPTIVFQEYSRAHPQEYPHGLYNRVFGGGFLFKSPSTGEAMNVLSRSVTVAKQLSREERMLFHNFCRMTSCNQHPLSGVDGISLSDDLADADEAPFLNGPAISGRITSNAE